MLFNLSCCRQFPNKQTGKEIFCSSDCGPYFTSDGYDELSACSEPFNGDGECRSNANNPGYSIPLDSKSMNMLTN